jgi:N-methylhydantoinase B
LTKFVNVRLKKGDVVRLVSPSGGGYGDPLSREPALVLNDVIDRFITKEQALEDYGVVITPDTTVDLAATTTARSNRR